MNAQILKPLLKQWDAAVVAWNTANKDGQRHLTEVANSATALGFLNSSSSVASSLGPAIAEAAEVRVYDTLLREHRALVMSVDGLRAAVRSMSSVADAVAKSFRSAEKGSTKGSLTVAPTLVTHDVESLSFLLKDAVAMYQAQLTVCESVSEEMRPDFARAASSNTLTL